MMAPSPTPLAMTIPVVINCRSSPPDLQASINSLDLEDGDASVMSDDSQPKQEHQQQHYEHRNTRTVLVFVGGEAFSFPVWAFQKFLGLPWKCDSQGVFSLNSSAAVFEVLLDYTLFGTMPAYDTMSAEEFQEFETMALAMGGLTALIEHFDRKDSYLVKELRQGKRRRSSGASRHFVLNPEDCHTSSPNSIAATRCARFLGALCGVAELITRRRANTTTATTNNGNTTTVNITTTSADKK